MPTINEGDCCGCGTPPPCTPEAWWVLADHVLPGAAAMNPVGSFAWPSGGDPALTAQNQYCPWGGTLDPEGGDNRAATFYLQIDDDWSSSIGGPGLTTENATATRTRKFDKDTGQQWYESVAVTSTSGTNASGSWSLDVTTGNVTTSGSDPFDLWVNHNAVAQQSIDNLHGTDNPLYDSMTLSVSATVMDYHFSASNPDGTFTNSARKVTLSSPVSLGTLASDTVSMLTTIDLTNLAATYTYDDSTTHAISGFTGLYWVEATISPAAGKFIAIHDGGLGGGGTPATRAELSIDSIGLIFAEKGRVHVCSVYNLYEQELTSPVPNTAAPGAPDNGSSQSLSGSTNCTSSWCAGPATCYVSPSDIGFTWGYATPGAC